MARRDSKLLLIPRGGAVAARRAHDPKVVGSNPTPATKTTKRPPEFSRGLVLYSLLSNRFLG